MGTCASKNIWTVKKSTSIDDKGAIHVDTILTIDASNKFSSDTAESLIFKLCFSIQRFIYSSEYAPCVLRKNVLGFLPDVLLRY